MSPVMIMDLAKKMSRVNLPLLQQIAPQSPASDYSLIIAAAGGVILLVLLLLLIRGYRRRARAEARSVCGRCGYMVAGLPTFACPECGSDLREVGIVRKGHTATGGSHGSRPSMRDTVRFALILGAWTIVYAILYATIGTGSYPRQPWDSANRPVMYGMVDGYLWPYQGKSQHSVTMEPNLGEYRQIVVTEDREAKFQGWRNASELHWTGDSPGTGLTKYSITLRLELKTGKTATMDINPYNHAWSYDDPQNPGKTISGIADETKDQYELWRAIYGWMMLNDAAVPAEDFKAEPQAVADLIIRSTQQGTVGGNAAPYAIGRLARLVAQQQSQINSQVAAYPFKNIRGTAADTYGPAWSIYWLSIPFGLGLYSYGTNWIWVRYRRRRVGKVHPHDEHRRSGSHGFDVVPSGAAGQADSSRPRSRTLTIVFTDLKDYTQRTANVPREGMRALLQKNREIVEGVVSATDGVIVKSIGDAYLVTYDSATDAVLAALAIQRAAARYNAAGHPTGKLEYRIALSTGEVTIENGDVFGTPVNVASRVQALAEPGTVYLTESTLHAVNAAEVRVVEIGPREIKGIATPVRLFEAVPVETPV
jgi:class 3 adenylate cyclase